MITSKTKIMPTGCRFLVKLIDGEAVSQGGIIIPENAQNRGVEATILAVGDGQQDSTFTGEWPPYKEGDRVLVGRWAGEEISIYDIRKSYYIITVAEIIAKLEGD